MSGVFPPSIITAAIAAYHQWNIPASVSLAQWAVESAWGKSMPSGSLNPFGIKAAGSQPFVTARTREVYNGKSVYIEAHFRKFASSTEAFEAHAQLLATASPYKAALAAWVKTHDVKAYVPLMAKHYATDPNYAKTILLMIASHNLTQYDKGNPSIVLTGITPVVTPRALGYGWQRDLPHTTPRYVRDGVTSILPSTDLRAGFSPCYDQLQTSSCVGNAVGSMIEFWLKKAGMDYMPSRLFIYYCARALEDATSSDAGCQIFDAITEVLKRGAPDEDLWKFDPKLITKQPPLLAWQGGALHRVLEAQPVNQNIDDIKHALSAGLPVAIGFTVYPEMESDAVAASGVLPMPKAGGKPIGGHAVVGVGHSDLRQTVLCRNSWGTDWGQNGYFEIPYAYLIDPNLASDFWVIKSVQK